MSDYPRSDWDPDAGDKALWDEFEVRFIHKFSEEYREDMYERVDEENWFCALLYGVLFAESESIQLPEDFIQCLEKKYVGDLMPWALAGLRKKGLVVP